MTPTEIAGKTPLETADEPQNGVSCPISHRIVRKTMFGIVKLMLCLIAACLIYLAYTSR